MAGQSFLTKTAQIRTIPGLTSGNRVKPDLDADLTLLFGFFFGIFFPIFLQNETERSGNPNPRGGRVRWWWWWIWLGDAEKVVVRRRQDENDQNSKL